MIATKSGYKRDLLSDDTVLSDTASKNFETKRLIKKVFDIPELLLHILRFLVVNDLDGLIRNRKIRTTSVQFNKYFINILHYLLLICCKIDHLYYRFDYYSHYSFDIFRYGTAAVQ